MSKKDLKKNIRACECLIISEGTLRTDDLLQSVGHLMHRYRLRTPLLREIEDLFERVPEDASGIVCGNGDIYIPEERRDDADYLWHEDVFHYMNDVAPRGYHFGSCGGYHFGSCDGDGACIGFFRSCIRGRQSCRSRSKEFPGNRG